MDDSSMLHVIPMLNQLPACPYGTPGVAENDHLIKLKNDKHPDFKG
jgi:hypothetical protein